jgi:hypothetical protein
MDEGTTGVSSPRKGAPGERNESETAAELEQDIEQIRNHLSDVAGELDRRRHRLLDIPGQLRKRAKPIAVGTVALAAVGLGIWWWRSRSRRTLPGRLVSMLPDGLTSGEWWDTARKRVAETIHPTPPTHPVRGSLLKISTAAAAAAASVVGKRLAGQVAEGRWPAKREVNARPVVVAR